MSFAQPTIIDPDAIINQQRQWQEQQQREFKQQQLTTETKIEDALTQPTPSDEELCFTFSNITLRGDVPFKEADHNPIIAGWLNKCLSLANIDELVITLAKLYQSHGYPTAKIYINEQDLTSGTLLLTAIIGKVSKLEIIEDQNLSGKSTLVFPQKIGKAMHLYALEQGLDNINRLRSHRASLSIAPGKNPADMNVIVEDKTTSPWFIDVAYDNYGSSATGRHAVTESATIEDIVGLYESFRVVHKHAAGDDLGKDFQSINGYFSIPYGWWNLHVSAGYFSYATQIPATNQSARSDGSEISYHGELERVIHYTNMGKVSASIYGDFRDNHHYINDTQTEANSRKQTNVGITLSYLGHVGGGVLSTSVSYECGTDWLGARDDDSSALAEKAQYQMMKLYSQYVKVFTFFNKQSQFSSNLVGQYSPDRLYGSEQLSFANAYAVRGFQDVSINRMNGMYSRNELSLDTNVFKGKFDRYLASPTPYIGFDAGTSFADSDPHSKHVKLASTTLGLRFQAKDTTSIDLSFEKPLIVPGSVDEKSAVARFSTRISF